MRKILSFMISALLMVSLVACGSNNSAAPSETSTAEPSTAAESESSQETASSETDETSEASTGESTTETTAGKTLVVYYSATGNTEEAANYIADATGADIFELELVNPYTDEDLNYNDEGSRVVYEHENPDDRDTELVASTVDNWADYDTVFIGYPIWWHEAAWPVDGFVEANDFTGKTVIPFCTSGSSGLEESGELLAEMAGTGEWLEGQRFSSSVAQEDVEEWLAGLNL